MGLSGPPPATSPLSSSVSPAPPAESHAGSGDDAWSSAVEKDGSVPAKKAPIIVLTGPGQGAITVQKPASSASKEASAKEAAAKHAAQKAEALPVNASPFVFNPATLTEFVPGSGLAAAATGAKPKGGKGEGGRAPREGGQVREGARAKGGRDKGGIMLESTPSLAVTAQRVDFF